MDTHHVDQKESSRTQSVTALLVNGSMESSAACVLQDVQHAISMETVPNAKLDFSDGPTMMAVGTSVHSDTASLETYVHHTPRITTCMSSHLPHVKTECKSGNHVTTPTATLSEYMEVRPNLDMSQDVSRNHSSSKIEEHGSTVNTT